MYNYLLRLARTNVATSCILSSVQMAGMIIIFHTVSPTALRPYHLKLSASGLAQQLAVALSFPSVQLLLAGTISWL
jgi:hypothetical protein